MSKEAQLPPRYPLQKKNTGNKHDHDPHASCIGLVAQPHHRKSMSQSFIVEEQPPWYDELLSDQDSDPCIGFNLRSSNYSSTLLDLLNEQGNSTCCESDERLESSYTYGPNSPKRSQQANPIISTISDSVDQGSLQYLYGNFYESESAQQDNLNSRSSSTNGESIDEMKSPKRLHPGQRCRAQKLQYITELERTVCILQTFESELAIKLSVMSEQRSTLQAENSKLKQHMIRLHREKLLADGQYQSLTKEAEMLKAHLSSHSHTWQMLDLRKLDLS